MTPSEISLAFAREVAGYSEANTLPGYEPRVADGYGTMLPDYANDWNATIAVLKAKGLKFQILEESCIVEEVEKEPHYLDIYNEDMPDPAYGEQERLGEDYYTPRALCLAAIKCVREQGNG